MAESKVIDLEVKTNLGSLKSQLREAQAEVAKMSEKFGAASIEASNAAKAAGILKDKIGDAKALTDAFNPDAKFKSVTASISGVAGGFAAYEGAMNLVGVKSQEVEAALLKVQSAMAISQGLQSVGESIDSFKQLGAVVKSTSVFQGLYNFIQTGSFTAITATTTAQVAETAATVAQGTATVATTTATTGASVAMRVFRAALIATGIGALVVGLLMAADALGLFSDNSAIAEENQKKLDKALEDTNKALQHQKEQYEKLAEISIQSTNQQVIDALNRGASEKELTEIKRKGANDRLELLKNEYDEANLLYIKKSKNGSQKEFEVAEKAMRDTSKKYSDERIRIQTDEAQSKYDSIKKTTEQEKEQHKKQIENNKEKNKQKQIDDEKAFELKKSLRIKQDEEFAAETAALKKQEDDKNAIELAGIEARSAAQREKTAKDIQDKKKRDADELTAAKTLNAQKLQAVQDGFNTIANLAELFAGKNRKQQKIAFDIQKAANIANATIDTYKAAQGAYASLSGVPVIGPVLGAAAAGAAVTAGLINIKKIASTSFNGGTSGGGGSTSSDTGGGGSSAPAAPQSAPNFNLVGATGLNQLDMLGKPIQAFVVGGEVTTYQELERNRLRNATL